MDILIGTFAMRPYVFAFFAAYLFAAVLHIGWRKTITYTIVGYFIAFASEWLSINFGFPYGWYYYIDATKNMELWIAGVPFFDSLSYVFLSYCSFSTALFILSPLKTSRFNLITLETSKIRHSFLTLILASFLQTFLDIVIDPVALQGKRWFLGQIYGYRESGVHFGVPLSNYAGWLLTSFFLIAAIQLIDKKISGTIPQFASKFPFRSMIGTTLYISVLLFNWGITIWLGENLMAITGIFIYTIPIVMTIILAIKRCNRYSRDEYAEWENEQR